MKKIISLAIMVVLAFTLSASVFAASSPEGDVIPDSFHINGTVVTEDGKPVSGVTVDFSGDISFETDSKGGFKAENIKEGKYTLTIKDGSNIIGELVFEIRKGDKTNYSKLDDGSYLLSVAENVTTINVNFLVKDGNVSITGVKPAGNDSPISPPLGDVSFYAGLVMIVLSFAGIVTSVYFRKRYSM